jgi:hypothetical protein
MEHLRFHSESALGEFFTVNIAKFPDSGKAAAEEEIVSANEGIERIKAALEPCSCNNQSCHESYEEGDHCWANPWKAGQGTPSEARRSTNTSPIVYNTPTGWLNLPDGSLSSTGAAGCRLSVSAICFVVAAVLF